MGAQAGRNRQVYFQPLFGRGPGGGASLREAASPGVSLALLHLEVHGRVALAVRTEDVVVAGQDGVQQNAHQRGHRQTGQADVNAAHGELDCARIGEVDAHLLFILFQ